MAEFTLTVPAFPNGTEVKVYPQSNWAAPGEPSGAPVGSATSTKTMTSGTLTFTGLTEGTEYWAVGEVSSVYRYVKVLVPVEEEGAGVSEAEAEALFQKLLEEQIGVTLLSQTDPALELLKTLDIEFVYCGENPNVTRPEVAHVIWVIKEGVAPNNQVPFEKGQVKDVIWYLAELPE